MKYKEYLFDSFRLLTIKTDKFKNCIIDFNFLEDINKINLPKRFLLTSYLTYTSKKYHSKREMLIALEELYNSDLNGTCKKIGNLFQTNFRLEFINPKYVKDKKYLEKCLSFIIEILLNPNFSHNKVDERSFEILKEQLLAMCDSYKESASAYAKYNSLQYLFKDSITSKRMCGTKEEVLKITKEDLIENYQNLFSESKVDIVVIGNLDMGEVAKIISKKFIKKTIVENLPSRIVDNKVMDLKQITEEGKYAQTKLLVYLQYKDITDFEQKYVSNLYCQILGSASNTDKLAYYLRIKNSLAYYRSLEYSSANKYFLISTGIKYENTKKALKYIKKALKEMEDGDITDEYFAIQKEKILSNIIMGEDDEYYLINNYYYHKALLAPSIEQLKENISKVTIQDVKNFAKKLSISLIYILKETKNNAGN